MGGVTILEPMRWKMLAAFVVVAAALAAGPADAQQKRGKRPVIVVRPDASSTIDWYDPLRWRPLTRAELRVSQRLVRQCIDGYAVEPRPSGTVITPRMVCRWVLR